MADAQSVVELVFQGVDKTGEATQAALNNAQKFSSTVQNIAAPIADATEKAIKFEAALIATSAALVGFAIKTAGDFDAAWREITTLIDEPVEALDGFRQAILDYARDSAFGLNEVTDAVYSAISAGIDYTDSLDVVAKSEQLAVAGKSSLKESVIALEGSLNAYAASADQAEDFSDALFTAVKEGITTIPELSNALSRVTLLAANTGVEFGELVAAISTLTSASTPTAEAVTAVRAVLNGIISPTQDARRAFNELEIEVGASALQSKGLAGVLEEVKEATGGNADAISRLFGSVNAFNAVLALTGESSEKFNATLLEQENRAGATAEAYERMAGTIGQANKTLVNRLQALFVEIGTPLLDQYGSLTEAIGQIFNALGVSVKDEDGLGGLVQFVESVMSDLVGVFEEVARNLPAALSSADLSGFQRNIEGVIDGIRRLLSGIDVTSEDGLRKLIEGIGEGLARLGVFTGDAIAVFGPLLDAVLRIAETIVNLDERWFKLGGTIGGVSIILDRLLPQLDTLLLLFVAAKGVGIKGGATAAAGAVDGLGFNIKTLAGILAAGGVGYAIGTFLVDPLDKAVDRLTGSGSLGGAIYDLQEQFQNSTTGISGFGNLLAGVILDWVNSTDELGDATRRSEAELAAMNAEWGTVEEVAARAAEATRRAAEEYGQITDNTAEANDALREFAESQGFVITESGRWVELKKPISEIAPAIKDADDVTKGWVKTLIDGVPTFTQVGASANAGFSEAQKAAEDAFKASETYLLKMEELASNERIKLIEARVSLDIAELESNTRIIEASFDSINNSISESYGLLGDLFALWSGTDDTWDKWKLESYIKDEQKRLDRELELQAELVRAQIELIKARTDAIYRGDAMIQIDGAGLQPHLEGFMWEILRTIQTRVNQDGLEMLLGTPA